VATQLQRAYGPALREQLGLEETDLAELVRGVMEPLLTQPFGEASIAMLLGAVQGKLAPSGARARARGTSWRARLPPPREQRRLHAGIHAHGAVGSSFDRGTFLLAKQ